MSAASVSISIPYMELTSMDEADTIFSCLPFPPEEPAEYLECDGRGHSSG